MSRIAFATVTTQDNPTRAILLFESLRAFGGQLADAPCMLLLPETEGPLPAEAASRLERLSVRPVPFSLDEEARRFPLASLAYAAAEAESRADGTAETLAWMVEDTLVLNPPTPFLLPENVCLACRPVHHTKIGSIYGKPPDGFWSLIYRHCGVDEERLFPMETCTRDNVLRPYFNAGLLVVRPDRRLLRTWRNCFESLHRRPEFEPFYEQDVAYRIFMHQAVLAGVALSMLERDELRQLLETVNYPLHLHSEYPSEHQPGALNELITCRYERIEDLRNSLKVIPAREPLKRWLDEKLDA
jgi:hypothetical protein